MLLKEKFCVVAAFLFAAVERHERRSEVKEILSKLLPSNYTALKYLLELLVKVRRYWLAAPCMQIRLGIYTA